MAATMNFFRAQDDARFRTTKLVVLLVIAILLLVGGLYAVAVFGSAQTTRGGVLRWWQPGLFCGTAGVALLVIVAGSLIRISALSAGGASIALGLGGRKIHGRGASPGERRLLNVVEEMAIASGMPVPACYVLEDPGINAFAAGNEPKDAVIGVTRGALDLLTRDELQGVVAHEFSHIGNGDMRLNLRLIGAVAGLLALTQLGYLLIRFAPRGRDSSKVGIPMMIAGAVVIVFGLGGVFFSRVIQASISRQREYLADASAVQFTRNPLGLAGALKKVARGTTTIPPAKRAPRDRFEEEPEDETPDFGFAQSEAQHLFFSSTPGFWDTLFSTHPPLAERIRRLDPAFDGRLPTGPLTRVSDEAAVSVSRLDGAAAGPDVAAPTPGRAPSNLEIQEAVQFAGRFPAALRDAVAEPIGAMGLVFACVLSAEPATREGQLAALASLAGGEVAREARRLQPVLRALPPGFRVPALDLALPTLRGLSPVQRVAFRDALARFGAATEDGLVALLVQGAVRRYLEMPSVTVAGPTLTTARHYGLVLSAVVHASSESESGQQAAYAQAVAALGVELDPLLPAGATDLAQVAASLDALGKLTVPARRAFVRACGVAVLSDGRAEPREVEVLRAVADTLGISFATGLGAA
jgi:Zn-dependent protease with chaperone function